MISFIIPAFNEAHLLGKCLTSIVDEIQREGIIAEIIVVDNGSTDNTKAVAIAHGARVVREKRKGVTFARQAGHVAARYPLEACIDADNYIPKGWLRVALKQLADERVVVVSGPVVYYDLSTTVLLLSRIFYFVARASHKFLGPMVQGGNYVIRKSTVTAMGGYDLGIEFYGEDTDTAVRASKIGLVKVVPEMWLYSSGRRLAREGAVLTTWRYVSNYVWITLFGKPLTLKYRDIRDGE